MLHVGRPPNRCSESFVMTSIHQAPHAAHVGGMDNTGVRIFSGSDVRYGSVADIGGCVSDVCFAPKSRHATSGHSVFSPIDPSAKKIGNEVRQGAPLIAR